MVARSIKSQGLPLNTIVLAILGVLVLILLVFVFTGGLSKFTGGVAKVGPTTIQSATAACSEYFSSAENLVTSSGNPNLMPTTQYCTATFNISGTIYNCTTLYPDTFTFTAGNGQQYECGSVNGQCTCTPTQ